MAGGFSFSAIFGKESAAYQLFVWQVLGQVISTVGMPGFIALQQLVMSRVPVVALSPADAVDAALKGHLSADQAAAEASLSGISRERFDVLLAAAGAPLAPEELVVALRRGLIPETGSGAESISFAQGVRESRLNPKWTDTLKALGVQLPTPVDALQAVLEGQIDEATGRELYARFGGDPQYYEMLFNTRGSAPTPLEAIGMANRGIIPWEGTGPDATTYEQAFLEGPWRNKWAEPYRQFGVYVVPPRSVTAMVRSGALTDDRALAEFRKSGMSQEMAAAMLADAHHVKAQEDRELAKTDILQLYSDRLIDGPTATGMLSDLGYNAADSAFLLGVRDFQLEQQRISKAVGRLETLYVAHKLSDQDVISAMEALGVPPSGRDAKLRTWQIERLANVKILTDAQICDAVYYLFISVDEGLAELEALGYSPRDAWIRLGVRLHGPPTETMPA